MPDWVFDSSSDERSTYWHIEDVPPGEGAHRQWLRFHLRLHDMQRHSPASHFAVVLRARIGRDADGRPLWIAGRGMTLGDTSLAQPADAHARAPGYGGARAAQIESFWPGGNFLWADTSLGRDPLRDDCWYAVEISVDDDRRVCIALQAEGEARRVAAVQDRASHPVPAEGRGLLIGLGRGPQESGPWQAEFRDLRYGWS